MRQETRARLSRAEPLALDSALPDVACTDSADGLPERLDLRRAIAPLRADDRRLLWLRYGEDLTPPATAAAMGRPEGTVKVRLHRLRRRLRAEIGAQ